MVHSDFAENQMAGVASLKAPIARPAAVCAPRSNRLTVACRAQKVDSVFDGLAKKAAAVRFMDKASSRLNHILKCQLLALIFAHYA